MFKVEVYTEVRDLPPIRNEGNDNKLSSSEISRYSRQLLLPTFGGSQSQLKLLEATVLIVGAGGLGCPSALYIAGSGVGRVILVDYDVIERSNLHRQVAHSDAGAEKKELKVASLCSAVKRLNPMIDCVAYNLKFNASVALQLVKQSSVVIDATDNMTTRYLINDACVLAKVPLVSGAAQSMDGQISVYNYNDSPCYRCMFQRPPPVSAQGSCSEGGVLGPVPGVIGTLQAVEAIKVLTGIGSPLNQRICIYDALEARFRVIKTRGKRESCEVCGILPSITSMEKSAQWCSKNAMVACMDDTIEAERIKANETAGLDRHECISVQMFRDIKDNPIVCKNYILIDVRPRIQYELCHLEESVHIPLKELTTEESKLKINNLRKSIAADTGVALEKIELYTICRRGILSQHGVSILKQSGFPAVKHITGGLTAWANEIDADFPSY